MPASTFFSVENQWANLAKSLILGPNQRNPKMRFGKMGTGGEKPPPPGWTPAGSLTIGEVHIMEQKDHKVTASRPTDPFDSLLSSMIGLPNGANTQPSVVQAIDFYGNTTSFMIQTVRTDQGVTAFVTQVNAQGSVRYILPTSVLVVLDRQRAAITTKLRRRNGKRNAEERMAAGIQPGFMTKRVK
jgi:hypothetical protein